MSTFNIKDALELLKNNLPEKLKTDTFFKELLDIIYHYNNELELKLINRLTISKQLAEKTPELKKFCNVTESEKSLIYFIANNSNIRIDFRLKKANDTTYSLLLSIMSNETKIDKKITYALSESLSKVEIKEIREKNGYVDLYDYDVVYYDTDKNVIPTDYELKKDLVFSDEFGVPVELARMFRLNFNCLKNILNKTRQISLAKSIEDNLSPENKFKFHPPFKLENLEEFLVRENDREMKGIGEYETKPFNETGKMKKIINYLKSQIGKSDELIISDNLYSNLSLYLYNLVAGIIYSEGIIIKKLNNIYTLYYIHLSNEELVAIPQELNEEEIMSILKKSPDNKTIPGLNEFFGLNRGRK